MEGAELDNKRSLSSQERERRGCEVGLAVWCLDTLVAYRDMCGRQFLLLFCWTSNIFVQLMIS